MNAMGRPMRMFSLLCAVLFALAAPGVPALELAQQDYMLQCQGCHLADGTGAEGRVPSFRGFLGNFLHVPGGREFIVQVPGAAHSPLDDARLAAVMNWMLENFSKAQIPPGHNSFSAEEVGRLRADSLLDVNTRRAELLRAIEEKLGVTETAGS